MLRYVDASCCMQAHMGLAAANVQQRISQFFTVSPLIWPLNMTGICN